jgi:hypothetical protein
MGDKDNSWLESLGMVAKTTAGTPKSYFLVKKARNELVYI